MNYTENCLEIKALMPYNDLTHEFCAKMLARCMAISGALRNASVDREPGSTAGYLQGIGDFFTALRRQRLASDKVVLQLATFLRSHDLFLELSVRTPRTLTANQVRHGGKQSTDGR
jgi:hypothetical protein